VFDKHPEYNNKGGNRHFWAAGYYVDTVGRNGEQIKQYIEKQSEYDRIEDNEPL